MLDIFVGTVNQYLASYSPMQILTGAWLVPIGIALFNRDWQQDYQRLQDFSFKTLPKLPYIGPEFKKEIDKKFEPALDEIDADIHRHRVPTYPSLPYEGVNGNDLLIQLQKDSKVGELENKFSGSIYRMLRLKLEQFNSNIFEISAYTNPLHAPAWPNLDQREAEVVSWCAQLYNGDETICGNITHGGTYSIMEACRTHKIWAFKEKGITRPNMVVPHTVHAAFDKAAQDYGIKLIRVPVDPFTQCADVKAMARRINKDTIMIVGSVPSFPTGAIDNIAALSDLALKHKIGLHVDACLGGFLNPFVKDAGFGIEPFGFELPGVTSISLDTHKYGQVFKLSSVVLFRQFIGLYQTYVFLDSPIGFYITPNQSGSRSGASILGTWGTLAYIGRKNYIEITKGILNIKDQIVAGLALIPEIRLLGKAELSVIAVTTEAFNIYLLSEKMHDLGWHLNNIQDPAGFHLCITPAHLENANFSQEFIRDLKSCVENIKENPNQKPKGEGAVYGMKAKIPGAVSRPLKEKLGRQYQYLTNRTQPTRGAHLLTAYQNHVDDSKTANNERESKNYVPRQRATLGATNS